MLTSVKTFLLHKRKITHSASITVYRNYSRLTVATNIIKSYNFTHLNINQHTFPHPKQWFWQSLNFCWSCQWPSGLGSDGRRGQEEQSQSPFFPLRQSNMVIFSFRFQVAQYGNCFLFFFDIRQSNMVIFSFRFQVAQHGNFLFSISSGPTW